ncbi:hypothetical protein BCR33DRAFT_788574 [Rhizoclosmatium globosum]|uniref:Uncharacterized protein n=1 Tax=Rhizoclosmatium globosum TaxID=329046 RepID=A0A1Y2BWM6_9FUNG|nr:hypothetical protein BCR33DRAFT_788574 [Rhizoclosmatium globosum]|eukprot:ORY39156.1 hypothetical protein BCR33DRAFT_788574 [Rhizoclosmatium globosum]
MKAAGATEQNNAAFASLLQTLRTFSAASSSTSTSSTTTSLAPFAGNQRDLLRLQIQAFKLLSANQALPNQLKALLFHDIPSPVPVDDDAFEDDEDDEDDPVRALLTAKKLSILCQLWWSVNGELPPDLLESLPSNLSNQCDANSEDASLKLKALIELKALKLLGKHSSQRITLLGTPALDEEPNMKIETNNAEKSRGNSRKGEIASEASTRTDEVDEVSDIEMEPQTRLTFGIVSVANVLMRSKTYRTGESYPSPRILSAILTNQRSLLLHKQTTATRLQKLGQSVIKYHSVIEKEEQKRAQRVSQERLRALKENDEAAYIKLLDEAKDGRIMQILNKTTHAIVLDGENVIIPDEDEPGGGQVDYYAVAHKIKEKVTKQSSLLVGGQLKEYQIKGLEWMISLYNNRLNGILADEMGLGKTIQTISLITYLIEHKKQVGPYLIIIPLATVSNWTHEFERWAPGVSKLVFKGGPDERRRTAQQIRAGNFQVCITTFEYIIREKAVLSKIKWVYMIIDEGHRMKNAQSKLSTTLMQYYTTRYRVILTGTPLQNNLPELWALLNFVLPKIFNSVKSFDEWFSSPFSAAGSSSVELNEEERLLMIKGLHKVLRPFLLRRLKKDVEKELPDKVETIVKCPMSALQRKITERVKVLRNIGPFDQTKLSGTKALNNLVMQFRKICNHPFVFPEVEDLVLPNRPDGVTEMIYRVSGKFELLDRILPKYFGSGHRVLMFFQMTQIMTIAEDLFRLRGWKHLRLDGSVKGEDREQLLKEFNKPDSEYNIFILSTRAGGLGLNLQTADTVIIFDSDWNPHQDLQAQDRAHRIGQKKEVRILRLITSNSIEEHILEKAQQKLALDGKVIQAGKFDQKTSDKDREELLRMLARSPEEVELFGRMDREREEREMILYNGNPPPRLITEAELPECYAIDFSTLKREDHDDLLSIKPRERKEVHYGDVLTEKEWLDAADKGTLHDVESSRRAARKSGAVVDLPEDEEGPTDVFEEGDEEEGDQQFEDDGDEDVIRTSTKKKYSAPSGGGKKRGKKSKAEMLANDSISPEQREQLTLLRMRVWLLRGTRNLSEAFEELPGKRHFKDYYDIIETPICLAEIQKKINGFRYFSLAEVRADFALLFSMLRDEDDEDDVAEERGRVRKSRPGSGGASSSGGFEEEEDVVRRPTKRVKDDSDEEDYA